MVPTQQAVALPLESDLSTSQKEVFGRSRSMGKIGRVVDPIKEVLSADVTLQDQINLRLVTWIIHGSACGADANPVVGSRLAQKLIAPVIGSVKVQVGGGLLSDGTVFASPRNISEPSELLGVNIKASSSTMRPTLIRGGRLGTIRSLDANPLLSTTLIGGFSQVLSLKTVGTTMRHVEQRLGYKFLASEYLTPTLGRHLGGARFDTTASLQKKPPTNIVEINTSGNWVASNLFRKSIDGRSEPGVASGEAAEPQKRIDKNTLVKNESKMIFYLDSSSVLVSYFSTFVVTTITATGWLDVYPVESHQPRALFLSRLKVNSAATTGMIANSLALP